MHPRRFFKEVVTPNINDLEARPDDMRAVVNTVLTVDALVGQIHAYLHSLGDPEAARLSNEGYREKHAGNCPGYNAVRDAAATLKHGTLDHSRRNLLPRLIRTTGSFQSTGLVLGLLDVDDELGGDVAILCLENGLDAVRVDHAIAATCRMLLPILNALPEEDRTSG